jgi:hypothetical protein
MNYLIPIAIIVILVISLIILDKKTTILRDDSSALKKPYSFSRVQLAWWTVIITGSYVYELLMHWNCLSDTSTCQIVSDSSLVLLGISASTTAAGKLIDSSQQDKTRHQDLNSEGFFIDLLSDENGVSIHRLQCVAFHILFGIIFLVKVYYNSQTPLLPNFEQHEWALLGISSGTYAALKTNENNSTQPVG